jgi:SGNH domain (fused to AT3 domains)
LAEEATAAPRAHIAGMQPAQGQPDPRSLWASKPIPDVAAAVSAARRNLRLPKSIVPSLRELARENAYISYGMRHGCQPAFGPGTTSDVCLLGDSASKRRVVLIGDSHAGMWVPALEADGRQQGFAVVPLDKPGCVLNVIHENLPGWPCANWYRWAVNEDRRLHPVVTIVAFEFTPGLQANPSTTSAALQAVLGQVTHGVLLADPPGQLQQPSSCISRLGATMRTCSDQLPSTYVPLMQDLAAMAAHTHHPAIPTLQWFCLDDICPMVIDRTLTLRDKSHFTMEYSTLLGPLLGRELRPILARLEHG